MNYLLDTHTLIWSILETGRLSSTAKKIIKDPKNLIVVSAINFWEISLKFSLGKLELKGVSPNEIQKIAVETGFDQISLLPEETATYHNLTSDWHRDPFDRMLIWQAIQRDLILLTKDEAMKNYKEDGLKSVW